MPALNLMPEKAATVVLTTDNTQTTAATFTTKPNKAYLVKFRVGALKTNDFNLAAGYVLQAVIKNVGGTLTQGQSTVDAFGAASGGEDAGAAAWACVLDTSGSDIRVRVTGANSTNITWSIAKAEIFEFGQSYANFGEIG